MLSWGHGNSLKHFAYWNTAGTHAVEIFSLKHTDAGYATLAISLGLVMLQVHGMNQVHFDLLLFSQAKTSADMGHWLGLLLSQTGSKTDPEELTYDYVNAERISSIVNAAKTSL